MADLIDRSETTSEMLKHAKGTTVIGGQTFRTIKLEDALDAIAALPAQGVRVKPLVWTPGIVHLSKPLPGMEYVAVSQEDGRWSWWLDGDSQSYELCASETAAKAAAQRDYESRVLTALAPAEADGVRMRPDSCPYGATADDCCGGYCNMAGADDPPDPRDTPAPVDALVKAAEPFADYMTDGMDLDAKKAFKTNLEADRMAYFKACSSWFHAEDFRELERADLHQYALRAEREKALRDAAAVAYACGPLDEKDILALIPKDGDKP